MTDQKKALQEIVAKIPRRTTPREPVTREDLERQAEEAAEGDEEVQEAKQVYEEKREAAYERILADLLEEHEDDLSD